MINSISSNTTAITNYANEIADISDRVSKGFTKDSDVDIAKQMSGLITTEHGLTANVKSVQTADEMIGTMLDIIS
ncbi:hypothetical protein GMMP15_1340022 [Candidatus Magnetomoraceae bacterium gMMP-15]